jgi:hypothetical protein
MGFTHLLILSVKGGKKDEETHGIFEG